MPRRSGELRGEGDWPDEPERPELSLPYRAGKPMPVTVALAAGRGLVPAPVVRVPAETHRRLAVEAAEQHVSLNQLAVARLSGT